jgi:general secretion pathway protein K
MKPPRPWSRQRGVALIIALVLFALAAILAVRLAHGSFLERKRAFGLLAAEQAFQFGMGAEALAADVLNRDDANQDTPNDIWATAQPPIPLRPPNDPEGEPMGELQGTIEDLQGRFNLNNLLLKDPDGKKFAQQPLLQLQRILTTLNLETKWAALVRDWIDPDGDPYFPDGAEDAIYTSLDPPYRTGNWPMQSPSELLALPEFGAERYRRLAPYITALPVGSAINVCTASGVLLDSLGENVSEFSRDPDTLVKNRKSNCFPTMSSLKNSLPPADYTAVKDRIAENSKYFRLTTIVTLGTSEFTLYSLLQRDGTGHITPLQRSFGTL